MALQHQRIPLGTVNVGGRTLDVYITLEWLKVLQGLDGSVTTIVDGGGSSASPDNEIDLPYEQSAAIKALAIALRQALGVDTTPQTLVARVEKLERRMQGMEQAP